MEELIKLAQTYKVSELIFDTRATKRRTNYFLWSTKLHPILALFPQTSKVFNSVNITPYDDAECVGNKALYLLISATVDEYFQRAIKKFEGYGGSRITKAPRISLNALPLLKLRLKLLEIRILRISW